MAEDGGLCSRQRYLCLFMSIILKVYIVNNTAYIELTSYFENLVFKMYLNFG